MKQAGALFAVCWVLCGITAVILLTAGNGGYLADQMLRCAPPEETGLPAAEYPGVGAMIAGYLTGETDRFQYTYSGPDGQVFLCFRDYEEAHMADCRGLIRLDRTVMAATGGLGLILAGAAVLKRRQAERFCGGILLGLRILGIAGLALLIWAAADFDGFFVAFHRAAFTNDGWLLDPRTDLLIRLMPESFFTGLGIRGLVPALIPPAVLDFAARAGLRKIRSRDGK